MVYPLIGTETLQVLPTQSNGQPSASTVTVNTSDIAQLASSATTFGLIGTPDNGTTQTLTTPMVVGNDLVFHVTTGGTTPSLTMPLATAIIAAIVGFAVGDSYVLRVINTNSGTATMVTNTGITTTGTLTVLTNTWREFVITMTGAATLSMVSVGTGTAP